MGGRKLVQLACMGDGLAHVGQLGGNPKAICISLCFHHKLGKLYVVKGTLAVSHLNANLESAVKQPCLQVFPLTCVSVQTFNDKEFAADTANWRQSCQSGLARNRRIQFHAGHHIDQGV